MNLPNGIGGSLRLLIEPVWNRNTQNGCDEPSHILYLLIEPVWNRNRAPCLPKTQVQTSFNRTSMESKLESLRSCCWNLTTSFNRTSMESKLRCWCIVGMSISLLIEPVWNRNKHCKICGAPVNWAFNRTSMESKPQHSRCSYRMCYLLIEPVWNRNIYPLHSTYGQFNF